MIEFLLQFIAEFLLQLFCEALVELGFHSLEEPFRRRPNPWLAALGYLLIGALIGAASLLIVGTHLVREEGLRIVNLVVTPLLVGMCMSALGTWRTRRGQTRLRLDSFAYGYLFALSFALIRYWFAT